jgi:hypothetical protein
MDRHRILSLKGPRVSPTCTNTPIILPGNESATKSEGQNQYLELTNSNVLLKAFLKQQVVLSLCGPVVTVCTARFNIHKFYVLPTQCIYVFCVDLRKNSDYFPIQH